VEAAVAVQQPQVTFARDHAAKAEIAQLLLLFFQGWRGRSHGFVDCICNRAAALFQWRGRCKLKGSPIRQELIYATDESLFAHSFAGSRSRGADLSAACRKACDA